MKIIVRHPPASEVIRTAQARMLNDTRLRGNPSFETAAADELGRMFAWALVRDIEAEVANVSLNMDKVAKMQRVWANLHEEGRVGTRAVHALEDAGLLRVVNVVNKTDAELLKIKNFGRKSLNEVRDVLNDVLPVSDEECLAACEWPTVG